MYCPYLFELYTAFTSVEKEFYFTNALKDPSVKLDGSYDRKSFIQMTELQFSAELYSKWRNLIAKTDNDYSKLRIGFQISKKFIQNNWITDKSSFKPDLVLHQSQVDFDHANQIIFIEIKTNPSLKLATIQHDLNKIHFAMDHYGFQNGVLISVNSKFDRLKSLIFHYLQSTINKVQSQGIDYGKLYLFHANMESDHQIISFKQIISEFEKNK